MSTTNTDYKDKEKVNADVMTETDTAQMLPSKEKTSENKDMGNGASKIGNVPVTKGNSHAAKSVLMDVRTIIFSISFGILFGFFINKGTVFVAPTIRKQMLFQRFAMLKMFLAAVGTSMLSVTLLEICCSALYGKIVSGYIEHNSRRNILHFMFGGAMIGIGMVVCGSCPGTVFVQVGSGIVNSLFTCLGGLLGTYFYYIVVHERVSQEKLPSTSLVLRRVSDLLHLSSIIVHLAFGLIFLAVAIGLEFVVPWKSDLNPGLLTKGTVNPNNAIGHIFGMAAWPPSACGAGVGLLQLLFIFFLEKSLGASSAFTVFAAQICRIKSIGQALPSLNSFAYGLKNYVALLFAAGAIAGSAISSSLSKTIPLGAENGTNIFNSIIGGFILLLGARCAGGCTSGQGISGTTHLLFGSFVTTACIFGGGIAFAFSYWLTTDEWLFQNL